MKVTRKQYERAVKDLPKLRKAEAIVQLWKEGEKEEGAALDKRELLEVERGDLGLLTTKTCKKGNGSVAREAG